jgi:hypothetical protein
MPTKPKSSSSPAPPDVLLQILLPASSYFSMANNQSGASDIARDVWQRPADLCWVYNCGIFMKQSEPGTITRLVWSWRRGDQSALDELTPLVYAELERRAASYSRDYSSCP